MGFLSIKELDRLHDICTYRIKVRGPVDEKSFDATSPLHMTVVRAYTDEEHPYAATLCEVCTDQSGLIGLIRHLHRQAFVLLSVTRER